MVGFNWVYKKSKLNRWCINTLPVKFFVPDLSNNNSSIYDRKLCFFRVKSLSINIFEICFPQKYIISSLKSDGIRSATLQLLFSSKSRPKPEDFVFPSWKLYDHAPRGLPLFCPVVQGMLTHYKARAGIMKGEFLPCGSLKILKYKT
jgi:hypothetical protein